MFDIIFSLFSPSQTLVVVPFFFSSFQRGDLGLILTQKSLIRVVFPYILIEQVISHIFSFFVCFCDFVVSERLCLF